MDDAKKLLNRIALFAFLDRENSISVGNVDRVVGCYWGGVQSRSEVDFGQNGRCLAQFENQDVHLYLAESVMCGAAAP